MFVVHCRFGVRSTYGYAYAISAKKSQLSYLTEYQKAEDRWAKRRQIKVYDKPLVQLSVRLDRSFGTKYAFIIPMYLSAPSNDGLLIGIGTADGRVAVVCTLNFQVRKR